MLMDKYFEVLVFPNMFPAGFGGYESSKQDKQNDHQDNIFHYDCYWLVASSWRMYNTSSLHIMLQM